ncbi:MAG: YraN family protein [Pseudomonadota bacterium]
MSATTYQKGLWAEALAEIFLRLKAYRILEKRYKTPVGEIDILATRKNTLIAIEVKARKSREDALYAINTKTQNRIVRALEYYVSHNPKWADKNFRFDIITIKLPFFIAHVDNAWRPRS